jgi:hypothetical protein
MRIDLNDVLSIPQDYGAGNVIEIAPAERKILHLNEPPHR